MVVFRFSLLTIPNSLFTLRGEAEGEAALFVELLGGVEIELIGGDCAAETFSGDVTERAVFPGVGGCKKDGAIAANEDVRFSGLLGDVLRRRRSERAILSRVVIAGPSCRLWRFGLRGVHLLRIGCGSVFHIVRKERETESAAKEKWKKPVVESAIAISIMDSIGMRGGEMRVIKTKTRDDVLRTERVARSYRASAVNRSAWARRCASNDAAGARAHEMGITCVRVAGGACVTCAAGWTGAHGGVRGGSSHCGAGHSGPHASALGESDRGESRERNDSD